MAIYKQNIVDIDLGRGQIHRSFLNHSIGMYDQQADRFGIRVLRDGEAVDLTGITVQGVFMPPTGSPIAITGNDYTSVEENTAEVILPQACYNYEGNFTLAIKLVDATNTITGTMRIVDGVVDNTHASGTVAPTGSVPTYQEVLAVYADMVTALETVDELDDEVSDLKSELESTIGLEYRLDFTNQTNIGYTINSNNVWAVNSSSSQAIAYVVPLPKGYTYIEFETVATNNGTIIAFLDTYSAPSQGGTPDFSDNYTGRIGTNAGKYRYELKSDTNYLYVNTYSRTGLDMRIKNAILSKQDFDKRISLLESDENLDLTSASISNYIIDTNNQWNQAGSSSQASAGTIRITDGAKKITVTHLKGSTIAILKNVDNRETASATPAFSDNYTGRITFERAGKSSFVVGDDDHYLYFNITSSDGTEIGITNAICSADVLRNEDKDIIQDMIYDTEASILPTLYEGWFDWKLGRGITAGGTQNSSKGFATTDMISVTPGNQLINMSNDTDDDDINLNFMIAEYANGTFVRRVSGIMNGDRYIVPAGIDSIRIIFGYASTENISIRKSHLSNNFRVKMLTAAKQNDFETPVYIAYGASTTIGTVHYFNDEYTHLTYDSAWAFPDYLGRALNLASYNHGHGSTGFIARAGENNLPNIMDSIYADYDSGNGILTKASLVTIIFGYGNDRGAGLPIGLYDDYYPYDQEGYHPSGSANIQEMLDNGATLMGCLNWCIKFISEKCPTVTLAIIFGAPSGNAARTVTLVENPDTESKRPPYKLTIANPYVDNDPQPYEVPSSGEKGTAQIKTQLDILKEKMNIPVIDLFFEGLNINNYNTYTTDENGIYKIFSTIGSAEHPEFNSHPNDAGYKMYAQFIAGKVISMFKH